MKNVSKSLIGLILAMFVLSPLSAFAGGDGGGINTIKVTGRSSGTAFANGDTLSYTQTNATTNLSAYLSRPGMEVSGNVTNSAYSEAFGVGPVNSGGRTFGQLCLTLGRNFLSGNGSGFQKASVHAPDGGGLTEVNGWTSLAGIITREHVNGTVIGQAADGAFGFERANGSNTASVMLRIANHGCGVACLPQQDR